MAIYLGTIVDLNDEYNNKYLNEKGTKQDIELVDKLFGEIVLDCRKSLKETLTYNFECLFRDDKDGTYEPPTLKDFLELIAEL